MDKPLTLVRNVTALHVVLQVAGVIVQDRGGHGVLYLRDRRFRFYRLTISDNDVCGALAQIGGVRFVAGDEALDAVLGLGHVERASVRATCLRPAISSREEIHRRILTLGDLAARLLFSVQDPPLEQTYLAAAE